MAAGVAFTGLMGLESHLLERVDAALLAVDLEGRILYANRFAEELYGWERAELIGRLATEFTGVAVEPEMASEIMQALSAGESWAGTFEVRRQDGTTISVHAVDAPLYDGNGALAGVVSLATDATRERVERFLAECSVALGSSLDFNRNLASLARLVVPFLGDICFIDVAEAGRIQRWVGAHSDPAMQPVVDELGHLYPPDPAGPHPAAIALRSGTVTLLEQITDEIRRDLSQNDDHYRLYQELNYTSLMCVPLEAGGRILGAVTVISSQTDRRYDDGDVEVLREVAQRAAVALDHARLFDDEQRARAEAESTADRLEQLQTLSTALARAVTVDEVIRVVGAIKMPHLGSENRGMWLLHGQSSVLELVRGFELRGFAARYATIALDSELPAVERDEQFPHFAPPSGEGASFAALPLIAEERALGVLSFGFDEGHRFVDDEVRFLTAVADQCAQALARAVLYDRARQERDRAERDRRRINELNAALQTSLLPPALPLIPGVEIVARYHPALAGLEVGGDFYDVFDTGGDWAVVVGDVCGKGPEAAAVTAVARWTIRSVAMDVRQPAQVLRKVNEALVHQQLDDRFCTIAYARVVPTSQGVRISVCRGGHPAPIIVRHDGTIEEIGTAGSLIGILPDVRLWEETTQLHSGDAIVFFTDGVTEARRGREQFGDQRLNDALALCEGCDASQIADAIEKAVLDFAGPEPTDDIALLVLRVP
jgi:sigma-B regulation protein RsbU (phosphoserine phosphatase)